MTHAASSPFRRANALAVQFEHDAEVRDIEAKAYRDLVARCGNQTDFLCVEFANNPPKESR